MVAIGPQCRYYYGRTWQFGVFYPTKVAYRVFPPPINIGGFLLMNSQVSPMYGVVCVGLDRIRIRY